MKKILNAIKNIFNSRSLKYGSNSIILIAAVVGIAVLVNVLVGMTDLKLDLTKNKLYSLTDISKNLLKSLDKDVTITGLFDEGKIGSGSQYKEVTDLLGQYQKYNHIKVKFADPEKNPGVIKELDREGTLNLQSGDFVIQSTNDGKEKKKKLSSYDLFQTETDETTYQQSVTGSNAEQGFTGAIKYVTSAETPVIYFTEGHNETSVDSDYTNVKSFLEQNNYVVKTINITTSGKLPEDAEILIVASPKSDLSVKEKDAIDAYLKAGGKALFMFDYLTNDPEFANFNLLLKEYNLAVDYDKVKETDGSRHIPGDEYTIVLDVSSNDIISQASQALFGNSRSISILKNPKDNIKTTSLIQTSGTAVGEAASSKRESMTGPLDIAVAAENSSSASKILVMGNASFISDSTAQQYGNYYQFGAMFFGQSLNWMFDKKDEVIVPTKSYESTTINITQTQASLTWLALIAILPLIILLTGLFVYRRRKHL